MALTFGIPHKNPVYCSNPVCGVYATHIVHTSDDPKGDVLSCDEHISQLSKGKRIVSLEKLKVAGERNA